MKKNPRKSVRKAKPAKAKKSTKAKVRGSSKKKNPAKKKKIVFNSPLRKRISRRKNPGLIDDSDDWHKELDRQKASSLELQRLRQRRERMKKIELSEDSEESFGPKRRRKNPKRRKNAILMVGNPREEEHEETRENPKRRKNAILMVGNPIKKNPTKRKKKRKNPKRRKNAILMVGNPTPIPIIGSLFGNDWVGAGTAIGGAVLSLMSFPATLGDLFQSVKNQELVINNKASLVGSLGGAAMLGYYFYRKNLQKSQELGEE